MKAFFGIVLVIIGLYAALMLGLSRLFLYHSTNISAWIPAFLVFGGEVTALGGALLSKDEDHGSAKGFIPKILCIVCFAASVGIIIMGLANVFDAPRTGFSLYLLVVGFIFAFAAANAGSRG